MNPESVPVSETVHFIASYLQGGERLLDIGCGKGLVAAQLIERGFDVTAIDKTIDAVQQARARGVDAAHVSLDEYTAAPYDALVLSRVLHHVTPLKETATQLRELLVPEGLLFVEDFDFTRMDAAGATWFYGLESLLETAGHLNGALTARDDGATPLTRWLKHNEQHGVNTGPAMHQALAGAFSPIAETEVPYLYRYVAPRLTPNHVGVRLTEAVLAWERAQIGANSMRALGWRWVGRPI